MTLPNVPTNPPSAPIPLRVLLVEDSEDDAELVIQELRHGGYEPTWERVDTSEAYLKVLFEYAPDAMYLHDAGGRIVDGNRTGAELTGYMEEEIRGQSLLSSDLVAPNDREKVARLSPLSLEQPLGPVDVTLNRKNKSQVSVEIRTYPLSINGEIRVLGIARDISERKLVERRLTDALNYAQTLLDASPVGITTLAASGDVVSTNEACARLIGATVERVKALNFRKLQSWQDSGLLAAAEAALATGQEQQLETHVVISLGKPLWLAARFVPFQFAGETRLLGLFTDISERKRAEGPL